MTSMKNLTLLILGSAFLQATLASSHCNVHLFKNSLNDDKDHLYQYHYADNGDITNAPFDGQSGQLYDENLEDRTISSFRVLVVDLSECGPCTVTGYSGKNLNGKSHEQYVDNSADGTNGQVDFDFCVKSFTLDCIANDVEEEEHAEEEEEEEQQEE